MFLSSAHLFLSVKDYTFRFSDSKNSIPVKNTSVFSSVSLDTHLCPSEAYTFSDTAVISFVFFKKILLAIYFQILPFLIPFPALFVFPISEVLHQIIAVSPVFLHLHPQFQVHSAVQHPLDLIASRAADLLEHAALFSNDDSFYANPFRR